MLNFKQWTGLVFLTESVLFWIIFFGCCRNRYIHLWEGEPRHRSDASVGKCILFLELKRNFQLMRCHKRFHVLTLMVLYHMIEFAWNTRVKYIDSLGHCGVAALRWPFSFRLLLCSKQVYVLLCAGFVCYDMSYKSLITKRYTTPCFVCMYEISITHFWFGLSVLKSLFNRFLCLWILVL